MLLDKSNLLKKSIFLTILTFNIDFILFFFLFTWLCNVNVYCTKYNKSNKNNLNSTFSALCSRILSMAIIYFMYM